MRQAVKVFLVAGVVTLTQAVSPAPATAALINAVEANDTFATAQVIPSGTFTLDANANIGTGAGGGFVNTSTTIPHATILRNGGTLSFDFFRFTTSSAGVILLDIDSAPLVTSFDTEIHLFSAAGAVLGSNDDSGGDPGDGGGAVGGTFNSRIETGVLPAGDYVVGVSAFVSSALAGGIITGAQVPANGTYTLHVSANAVPEPMTLLLLGAGVAGAVASRYRRRSRADA